MCTTRSGRWLSLAAAICGSTFAISERPQPTSRILTSLLLFSVAPAIVVLLIDWLALKIVGSNSN